MKQKPWTIEKVLRKNTKRRILTKKEAKNPITKRTFCLMLIKKSEKERYLYGVPGNLITGSMLFK